MRHLTPYEKHLILLEYSPDDHTRSFAALARRYNVVNSRTIRNWMDSWDRTPTSLQEKPHPGRPRALARSRANRIIRLAVGQANRTHKAINYTKVADRIRAETGAKVSERSVRRWGQQIGVQFRHRIKRTADECMSLSCNIIEQLTLLCSLANLVELC